MSFPCEQKETIVKMKEDVTDVKVDIRELVHEFKELARDLRTTLVTNGQMQTKVETMSKDLDELWGEHRTANRDLWDALSENRKLIDECKTKELQPLKEWRAKIDDRFNSVKLIPILCTVITVMITLYNIFHKAVHTSSTVP